MPLPPLSLRIDNLNLAFGNKVCFEGFTALVAQGEHIALIGRNGSGKSSLLKMISGLMATECGNILLPSNGVCSYVPQILSPQNSCSGGQQFNTLLSQALSQNPDILLLDEPTNHLDQKNRRSLIRRLKAFHGTLIAASHDAELLRSNFNKFWHIENNKIHIFSGSYDDYLDNKARVRNSLAHEIVLLNRESKELHHALMKEQARAAKSRAKGEKSIEQRKWPTIVSNSKARNAEETSGRKKAVIEKQKKVLGQTLSALRLPEVIVPKFHLDAGYSTSGYIISISDGAVGYGPNPILTNLSFSLLSGEKLAIVGDNGCGKSTILKAILGDKTVKKLGNWYVPLEKDIGYLDQHYANLDNVKSSVEMISIVRPDWGYEEIRKHLNDFLFRKNEEVNCPAGMLSGGEKARLSLALIAANPPKLLLLDEVTNNLDQETREHIIQILKEYPGTSIIISHDEGFLKKMEISNIYAVGML